MAKRERIAPAGYEHIKRRWEEQDKKVREMKIQVRWWQAATFTAWLFVLILLIFA